ncbi:hypothetical protein [Micromonospora zamorensis]|uniref:hypothetical protein n=1 Tax=Micromonospora zamorensis TaxID=709883 RepID=UPI002E2A2E0A|nr:hypothetical protein [Micromonospora zamorensis]
MTPTDLPRLIPTGTCWCGCGKETGLGSFFAQGHDKIAEAALIAAEYGSQVAQILHKHGYGPGRPVIDEAVRRKAWVSCSAAGCWYKGTPGSMRIHQRKYHRPSPPVD